MARDAISPACASTDPASAASSTSWRSSSRESRLSTKVVRSWNGRRKRLDAKVSAATTGLATRETTRSTGAASSANRSLERSASDLGTSSPSTIDRADTSATTSPSASRSAHAPAPSDRSASATGCSSTTPPNAPALAPTTVIPTWTVARNCSGCWRSARAARARVLPSSASSRRRDLRTERMAISAPEKKAFTAVSPRRTASWERMSVSGLEEGSDGR